jgi:hypothetical protein
VSTAEDHAGYNSMQYKTIFEVSGGSCVVLKKWFGIKGAINVGSSDFSLCLKFKTNKAARKYRDLCHETFGLIYGPWEYGAPLFVHYELK